CPRNHITSIEPPKITSNVSFFYVGRQFRAKALINDSIVSSYVFGLPTFLFCSAFPKAHFCFWERRSKRLKDFHPVRLSLIAIIFVVTDKDIVQGDSRESRLIVS